MEVVEARRIPGWTCGRRAWLRGLGVAAVAAGPLVACASRTALPTRASTKTVLVFQALIDANWFVGEPHARQLVWDATAPYRSAHPGIELRFYGTTVNPIAEMIAGTGPDVVQIQGGGGALGAWLAGDLLMDLTSFVHASNVDLTAFATRQLAAVRRGHGLYGLPQYTGTAGMVVNLSLLDSLGVPYPSPTWTYREWADFARRTAGTTSAGQRRYGGTLWLGPLPVGFYLQGWGGALIDPVDPARCLLGATPSIARGEFLYGLMFNRAVNPGLVQSTLFNGGLQASGIVWQGQTLQNASVLQAGRWDFYPMPTWPQGQYTFTNENFYGINAATRQSAAAWEFLRWICVEPEYQRSFMHLFLYPPALKSLYAQWAAEVRAVAPPLRGKHIEVFGAPLQNNRVVPINGGTFAYEDAQALGVLGTYARQILARQVSVARGFSQAAREVNNLEEAAAAHPATPPSLAMQQKAYRKSRSRLQQMFASGLKGSSGRTRSRPSDVHSG